MTGPIDDDDLLAWRWKWREGRLPSVRDRRGRIEAEGIEELLDVEIERRLRCLAEFGADESAWPAAAVDALRRVRAEIEAFRKKLGLGPQGAA
jgi:hypothetical protein